MIHLATQFVQEFPVQQADFGITLLLFALLFVANELLRKKPRIEDAKAGTDFNFPTATQGRVIPLIWGTVLVEGPNVIWYGDFRQDPISSTVKTGLFSKKRVITGFKYYVGMQFGLCRGPLTGTTDGVTRIWVGDKVVFTGQMVEESVLIDQPELFGGDDLGGGGLIGTVTLFVGTTTQPVSSYLTPFQTVNGQQPRYSGTVHMVFERGYVGNSTSIAPWKFEIRRIPNGLNLSAGQARLNGGNDANPANVAYEMLTDDDWGFAQDPADIDVTNFGAAAATLATEGNGFSYSLERSIDASELKKELERQMDGLIFQDHTTGKWRITLARLDYDILTVPEINDDNLIEEESYARGSWDETTNIMHCEFRNRINDYNVDYGHAQDMANIRIQGGANVIETGNYPGVKDADLANQLAWRDLRPASYPLAKASLTVNRTFWATTAYSVLAWTSPRHGFVRLPMRVQRVNFGTLADGRIKLDLVQDVFGYTAPAFGAAPGTGWTEPSDDLLPFTQEQVFESPRALLTRDPDFPGTLAAKIWAGAVRRGSEAGFRIRQQPPAVSGYSAAGDVYGFMRRCVLVSTLVRGPNPATTVVVTAASAADKTDILAAFAALEAPTAADVGTNLLTLMLVGSEFLLVMGATAGSGNDVNLTTVYRGVLDSVQADHSAALPVWLIFLGGANTDTDFTPGDEIDIKLLPFSRTDEVLEAAATNNVVALDFRLAKPYPPGKHSLNGVLLDTTLVSLEGAGSGDLTGIDLDLIRRDLRTADEVAALGIDAATTLLDFPVLHTTQYQVEVRNDPAGANTLLTTVVYAAGPTFRLLRNAVLRALAGAVPTTLGIVVLTRHTYEGTVRGARSNLTWAFTTASGLTGQFNFGALDSGVTSAVYIATTAGTFAFTISTALATGDVEARINAGAWAAVITTGNTTGNLAGVAISDTIEVRHTSSTAGTETFLAMNAAGAGTDGYAVLFKP